MSDTRIANRRSQGLAVPFSLWRRTLFSPKPRGQARSTLRVPTGAKITRALSGDMGWWRRRRKPSPAVHPLSHGSQSPARPGEGQAPPQGQTSQGGEASAPQQQGAEKPPQSGAFSQGIRSAGRFEIIVDSIRRTRSPREFHRTEQELSNRSVCFVRWV